MRIVFTLPASLNCPDTEPYSAAAVTSLADALKSGVARNISVGRVTYRPASAIRWIYGIACARPGTTPSCRTNLAWVGRPHRLACDHRRPGEACQGSHRQRARPAFPGGAKTQDCVDGRPRQGRATATQRPPRTALRRAPLQDGRR